ncbi:MAG TPA: alkaline phosphatase family protein, partial [Candidatus Polarisedimenticolia bacterium]|nr:alkaline phosphatase family protein [Candidatus Polarisedimenticolia bacterium]
MGRFAASRRRTRLFAGWGLLFLASYLCGSLKLVPAESETAIRQCRISAESPSLLGPGWHLSPLGLCRLVRYPRSPQRISFDFPDSQSTALNSQEGIGTRVKGSASYRLPADSAMSAYLLLKGRSLHHAVEGLLRGALASEVRLASFARISGAHRVELEASLSRSLGEALRKRGVVLQSLEIHSVRMARRSDEASDREPIPGAKLLLIGLDGADWRIIDPLIRSGKLPTLARLIRKGARARLKSVEPILSPVAWTSAATGFLPSEHGVLDFLVQDRRTGKAVPVTSRHRKVKAIWN